MRKRIRENADYDFGHPRNPKGDSFNIDSFDFKGRADMRVRNIPARYADNPMYDFSKLTEEGGDESMLDRLHAMLSKAGISDDEIRGGIKIKDKGAQKVAARLGIAADEVGLLLNSLTARMKDDRSKSLTARYEEHMMEEGQGGPLSYEEDMLGNVTIRNSETGDEKFIRGSEAQKLLARLQGDEDEQAVLSEFAPLEEGAELDEAEGNSYDTEIDAKGGSYNFPWKLDGRSGFATAEFSGSGRDLRIRVVSISDSDGERIRDPKLAERLVSVARDYIGHE